MKYKLVVMLFITVLFSSYARGNQVDELILVEGGSYRMGIEGGIDNPIHDVSISSFYIAKYELTVGEWKEYCLSTGKDFEYLDTDAMLTLIGKIYGYNLPDNHPMYYISWEEAIDYCNWLSKERGLEAVYTITIDENKVKKISMDIEANGYRLPTEAEWEFAAKGGTKSLGFKFAGSNNLDEVAWGNNNSDRKFQTVGSKKSNELGLFDMIGNVLEYTWDHYDDTYYMNSIKNDPIGPDKAYSPIVFDEFEEYFGVDRKTLYNLRTARGGDVRTAKESAKPLTRRYVTFPNDRGYKGFRLARNSD